MHFLLFFSSLFVFMEIESVIFFVIICFYGNWIKSQLIFSVWYVKWVEKNKQNYCKAAVPTSLKREALMSIN